MHIIHLTTFIAAPAERVFDLSRSVRLHKDSMTKHSEEAIGGKTHGLLELNDTVSWKAKHLFKQRQLQSKITELNAPHSFIDEQINGPFKKMKHEHFFKAIENGTIMIDQFHFELPHGFIGRWAYSLLLEKYMRKLLEHRNNFLKAVAESNQWKQYLS